MGGVGRIAYQHQIAGVPALTKHSVEIKPRGATQVLGVAEQPITSEILSEQLLAERNCLLGAEGVKSVGAPGLLPGFDYYRRQVVTELVRVYLKPAVLGAFKRKRKRRESLFRSKPDISTFARIDVRLEDARMLAASQAVDAVGRNNQVSILKIVGRPDLALKCLFNA